MMKRSVFLLLCTILIGAVAAGCSGRSQVIEDAAPLRSPYPTFTPTPPTAATPAGEAPISVVDGQTPSPVDIGDQGSQQVALSPPEDPAGGETALAVVNDDLINIRRGPGLQYPPLRLGMRGDQFTITGRSADNLWWQVCCVEERQAWISQTYIDADGPVDAVPVVDPSADVSGIVVVDPTPLPPPTPVPPAAPVVQTAPVQDAPDESAPPAEPPAPAFPFALAAQEQFPEGNDLVRIFLYVYQGDQVLPGYSLRVSKEGADLPVSAVSADTSGLTWPTASPRQRFHNMKVEFPGVSPGGTWEIQLIDGGGAAVGPVATFALATGDTNRELYVRYEKQ